MTPKRRLLLSAIPLLLAGAAASAEQTDDEVRFFRAVQLDDDRAVRELLRRGLDPNVHEPQRGETGLIVAMRYDARRVFNVLVGNPKVNLEAQSANGTTALMMAAFNKNMAGVQELIAKRAQVNRKGWTPLHFAAAAGDLDIMRVLLDNHAYIDSPSPHGLTPLMLAAREGMEDAVKLLLAEGADATLKDAAYKADAIEFANKADKPWIAKAIAAHIAAAKAKK